MSDYAHEETNKKLKKLEKRISKEYEQAEKEVQKKLDEYLEKFKVKDKIKQEQVKKGEITQKEYDKWRVGQIMMGERWAEMRDTLAQDFHNTNQIAASMTKEFSYDVYALNHNYGTFEVEAGSLIDTSYTLYDRFTVEKIIKTNPDLLPPPGKKIAENIKAGIDVKWNRQQIQSVMLQGLLQGESIPQIAKRLAKTVGDYNKVSAVRNARTMTTGAENAGRVDSYQRAKSMGIDMLQVWVATLDERTRDSHRKLDGEKIKVGDKWHPTKFSNGCRFPGDPEGPASEVYNCRCTLIGQVDGINFDLSDISLRSNYHLVEEGITYEDWKKGHEKPTKKVIKVDYSKFGGKEVYDILSKYGDFMELLDKSDAAEWNAVVKAFPELAHVDDTTSKKVDALIEEIQKTKKSQTPEKEPTDTITENEKKISNLNIQKGKLQSEIDDLSKEMSEDKFTKKYEGIWYSKDPTPADYADVKSSIQSKKDYYINAQEKILKSYMDEFNLDEDIAHDTIELFSEYHSFNEFKKSADIIDFMDDFDLDMDDIEDVWKFHTLHHGQYMKIPELLADLDELEKYGQEYEKLYAQQLSLKEQVSDVNKEIKSLLPKSPSPFGDDAYSQERKDGAYWFKSGEKKDADAVFRPVTGEVWQDASQLEKEAAYHYTQGSGGFNRPLRGYQGSWSNFKGAGNVDLNYEGREKEIQALTSIIDKCEMPGDTWLQRGIESSKGAASFFGISEKEWNNIVYGGTQADLEKALLGKEVVDEAFASCGTTKGSGFGGTILNIYCPEGTKAIYAEPFSYYGDGDGIHWDGQKDQKWFGGEFETIIQRGTKYRIIKVELKYGKVYADIEVVEQITLEE